MYWEIGIGNLDIWSDKWCEEGSLIKHCSNQIFGPLKLMEILPVNGDWNLPETLDPEAEKIIRNLSVKTLPLRISYSSGEEKEER